MKNSIVSLIYVVMWIDLVIGIFITIGSIADAGDDAHAGMAYIGISALIAAPLIGGLYIIAKAAALYIDKNENE